MIMFIIQHIIQSYLSTKIFLKLELYKKYGFDNHMKLGSNNIINKHNAIEYQNIDYFKYIVNTCKIRFNPIDLDYACQENYFKSLVYLINKGFRTSRNIMDIACEENYLHTVKFLHSNDKYCSNEVLINVVDNGNYSMIKYLRKIGKYYDEEHLVKACENGDFKIVKFFVTECDIDVTQKCIDAAIENNNDKIENYLLDIRYENGFFNEDEYGYSSNDFISSSDEQN